MDKLVTQEGDTIEKVSEVEFKITPSAPVPVTHDVSQIKEYITRLDTKIALAEQTIARANAEIDALNIEKADQQALLDKAVSVGITI